jgi:hypothetical protein
MCPALLWFLDSNMAKRRTNAKEEKSGMAGTSKGLDLSRASRHLFAHFPALHYSEPIRSTCRHLPDNIIDITVSYCLDYPQTLSNVTVDHAQTHVSPVTFDITCAWDAGPMPGLFVNNQKLFDITKETYHTLFDLATSYVHPQDHVPFAVSHPGQASQTDQKSEHDLEADYVSEALNQGVRDLQSPSSQKLLHSVSCVIPSGQYCVSLLRIHPTHERHRGVKVVNPASYQSGVNDSLQDTFGFSNAHEDVSLPPVEIGWAAQPSNTDPIDVYRVATTPTNKCPPDLHLLLPLQRQKSLRSERIQHYQRLLRNQDSITKTPTVLALGFQVNDRCVVSVILDGHHKLAACARLNDSKSSDGNHYHINMLLFMSTAVVGDLAVCKTPEKNKAWPESPYAQYFLRSLFASGEYEHWRKKRR